MESLEALGLLKSNETRKVEHGALRGHVTGVGMGHSRQRKQDPIHEESGESQILLY